MIWDLIWNCFAVIGMFNCLIMVGLLAFLVVDDFKYTHRKKINAPYTVNALNRKDDCID